MRGFGKYAIWIYSAMALVFLMIPIVYTVVFSFNDSKLVTVWGGFSTKWYGELFNNRQILDALWVSLKVAFWTANDLLQHLGWLAFRPPVPGYRHDAALFLRARGWIGSDRTHPASPRRPDADRPLLLGLVPRLDALLADLGG